MRAPTLHSPAINSPFIATACGLAWQRRSLLSAIPELAAHATPEQIVGGVLQRSMALLHAGAASLSLYDTHTGGCRLIAVASIEARRSGGCPSVVQRIPDEFRRPSDDVALERDEVLVLPDDDVDHPFVAELVALDATALYMALRYGDEVVGAMTVLREASERFSDRDRRDAHEIAHRATLALTTVRLV